MNKKLKLLLAMLTVTTALGVASACSDSSNTSSTPPESSSSSPVKKESYTVRFVNEDNSIISEKKYEEGTIPEKPADPTYSAEHYTYVFTGWDKEIKAVEDDVIYKAVYTKTAKEYTVTFKADGEAVGEPLKYTMDAPTVTPPQIPSKTDFDASWEAYELNGGNKEVNAVYTPTEYTVTFVNPRTGMPVLAPMKYTVQGKDDFVFPAIPDEIKQPGYTVSWDKTNADLVSGGLVVGFTLEPRTYKITYNVNGGSITGENIQSVEYGDEYTLAIATPDKSYKEFLGWYDENDNLVVDGVWELVDDLTLTAKYSKGITYDKATSVPNYFSTSRIQSTSVEEIHKGKAIAFKSGDSETADIGVKVKLSFLADFFEDSSVDYVAFDLKLDANATTLADKLYYSNYASGSNAWTRYESIHFDSTNLLRSKADWQFHWQNRFDTNARCCQYIPYPISDNRGKPLNQQ